MTDPVCTLRAGNTEEEPEPGPEPDPKTEPKTGRDGKSAHIDITDNGRYYTFWNFMHFLQTTQKEDNLFLAMWDYFLWCPV